MSHLKWDTPMHCAGSRGKLFHGFVSAGLLAMMMACSAAGQSAQPASPARLKAEATRAQNEGTYGAATALYPRALAADPTWLEGWWRYGGLLYEAHDFQHAALAFGHLTQLAPQNSLGFAMLGVSEFELHDWSNASLHLSRALARGGLPEGIANGAMYDYALVLLRQKNRNGAIAVLRLLQNRAPNYPDLIPAFGTAELNMDQLPLPGTKNAEAVDLEGKAAISVLQLNTNAADGFYRQTIAEYPQLPFAHLCLALFLDNLGLEDETVTELLAETKVNPVSPDAWIWLGRLALAKRNADQVIPYAQEAVKRDPDDGLPYLILGKGYVLKQQWSDALEALLRAEKLAPDGYEIHYALATVYNATGDFQSAIAERKLFAESYRVMHPQKMEGPE